MVGIAFTLILAFPFLVLLIPKEKLTYTSLVILSTLSVLLLVGSSQGYGICNKKVEFMVLFFALISIFSLIDKLTQKEISNWLKLGLSIGYLILNAVTFLATIWTLGDYFAGPEGLRNLDKNSDCILVLTHTGNFSDYQVTCELRKEVWKGFLYKTIDVGIIEGTGIDGIYSIGETGKEVIIESRNAEPLRLIAF